MNAVDVTDVALAYRVMHDRAASLKEAAINLARGRRAHFVKFWALDGVDMTVARGETVGLIGPNGAGKTTLLRLIAGVIPPTRGRVITHGTSAAMIDLGAGFNPELSARQNVLLYGTMLGSPTALLRRDVDAIAEWAGVTDFIDVPVRTFSSGMMARLAFSVATYARPDILIVDEVLAVGDAEFQARSSARMADLMHSGASVIVVSHDLGMIDRICSRAVWLDHGRVLGTGDVRDVIPAYLATTSAARLEPVNA